MLYSRGGGGGGGLYTPTIPPDNHCVCRAVCKLVRMWPRSCLIPDKDGNLPLHVACKKGCLKIAQVLMHSMYGSSKYEKIIKKLKLKSRDDDLGERIESLNDQIRRRKEKERKLLLKSMNARYVYMYMHM